MVFQQARFGDAAAEVLEAIAFVTQFPHFVLAAVELRVAGMMAIEAARIDLDSARSAAVAGAFDGFPRDFMHAEEIIAAAFGGWHAEARRAAGDIVAADSVGRAGIFSIAIVLEHEHGGELG